jgi:ankyrin repeat protein
LLHRAVEGRRLDGIRLMAELGFEVSGKTKHDNVGMLLETTPLHNAAWMGDLEMVKLLIELGADKNARDQNYNGTPLGWARYNNQQIVADYLVSIGAEEGK